MTGGLYTYAATAIVAAALASAGTWQVQDWRYGAIEAKRLQAESDAREREIQAGAEQRDYNQTQAGLHAAALAGLNAQLGDARAHIATLSRTRQCLGSGTVGVLNNIGKPAAAGDVRAPAGQPDGATAAAAGSAADGAAAGYASEHDTAEHIAICRARYAEVSGQLNRILDIEARRHAGN